MSFEAGQSWTYRAPEGFEASRLVIGAVATFGGGRKVICVSVVAAPSLKPDGTLVPVNVPFLPLTEEAFAATVLAADGTGEPCASFADKLAEWSSDPRGLTVFTVPFDGFVDRLIAAQMAEILKAQAA